MLKADPAVDCGPENIWSFSARQPERCSGRTAARRARFRKKSILVFDGMLSAELTRGKRKKLEVNSKAGRRNLQRFDLSGNVSSLSCSLCRLLHFVWAVGQLSACWMGERKSRQKTKDRETEIQQMTKQLERRISALINFLNEFAMRRHFCSDF